MAASTTVLPIMDMSINGAFSTQFTMTTVSGQNLSPQLPGYIISIRLVCHPRVRCSDLHNVYSWANVIPDKLAICSTH